MGVQLCPFGFPEEPYAAPLTLAFATDTQVPQPIVPVFLIHSLATPFCRNPRCACQQQKAQKETMLSRIQRAEVALYPAASFAAPEGGQP